MVHFMKNLRTKTHTKRSIYLQSGAQEENGCKCLWASSTCKEAQGLKHLAGPCTN